MIAFSCWSWIKQLSPPRRARRPAPLAAEPDGSEREAWRLEAGLHAALDTSAPYVEETFAVWRARVLEAPGSGPETVLVTRAPGGELAGVCALRVCLAAARDRLPRRSPAWPESARGQGHGLALKLAAIRRARELGARRLVADTSPANVAMLALNERLGYVAGARRPQPRRGPVSDFRIELRVRFAETDAMGVAHHAAYLPYLETRARRVPARARASLRRAARPRRPRVRGRGRRPALPRAAALRRRVHRQLRAGRARPRDVQPGLPRRARRRCSSLSGRTRHAVLDRETGAPQRLPAWLAALPVESA